MTRIKVPYFSGCDVELDAGIPLDDPVLIEFLKRSPDDRHRDSRHVFNYYLDFHAMVGGEDWLDKEMGIIRTPGQIWDHVTPGPVFIEDGRGDDQSHYVVMEAECTWEAEHGLMMVWKDGITLCKVGGYDGHVTNVNAFANDKMARVVYAASDKKFTTFQD